MTRVREVEPGSNEMPNYKSSADRLVCSLRKGYDNLRVKLKETRNRIKYYQIKTRDLEQSRDKHKQESKALEEKLRQAEEEIKRLAKQGECVEGALLKKTRKRSRT